MRIFTEVTIRKITGMRLAIRRPILIYHKNYPGYGLILNNILFPAAKKKQQKT